MGDRPHPPTGTYGAVEDLARYRVNLNKVITHWPDMRASARWKAVCPSRARSRGRPVL